MDICTIYGHSLIARCSAFYFCIFICTIVSTKCLIKYNTSDCVDIKCIESRIVLILYLYITMGCCCIPVTTSCSTVTKVVIINCHSTYLSSFNCPSVKLIYHSLFFCICEFSNCCFLICFLFSRFSVVFCTFTSFFCFFTFFILCFYIRFRIIILFLSLIRFTRITGFFVLRAFFCLYLFTIIILCFLICFTFCNLLAFFIDRFIFSISTVTCSKHQYCHHTHNSFHRLTSKKYYHLIYIYHFYLYIKPDKNKIKRAELSAPFKRKCGLRRYQQY